MNTKNAAAVALGKLGRGIKKKMSAAAIKQRQNAAKKTKTKKQP
jgi:hypothetical protein